MGLFTLLARCFPTRKQQSFLDRLSAAPLSPRRLERRRVLDASGLSAVLSPLGDGGEFVQVGANLQSQQASQELNGEEHENTPPDNLQIVPLDDLFEGQIAELAFEFDDPDFLDTHTVEIDWGDGTPVETINLIGGERFVFTTHEYQDDNPTGTPFDLNQVLITVTDSQGGQVSGSTSLTVTNVAPEITSFFVTPAVNENGTAELQLEFDDPGLLDTHTVEIDWGDGSPIETINLTGGERFVFTTHTYLDDNPTGTPMDVNEVTVTVTDDDTGSDMVMADVTVSNLLPTVSLEPVAMINENGSATLSGTIVDEGTLDTFSLEIIWGDALSPDDTQTFTLGTTALMEAVDGINWNPMTREFSLSHQYLDDNPTATDQDNYTISANVTDDDTGMGTDDESVLVKNVAPTIDSLAVTSPINENDFAELTLEFTDPGPLDTHTVEIDWGDGVMETILLTGGERFVFTTHQYRDDDPSGTPFDLYQVDVKITDDDGGMSSAMAMVQVNNVLPTVTLNPVTMINEDGLAMLSGSISDVGTLDTFTLELNWGDPLSPDNVQSFMLGTTALTEAADGINWNPETGEFSLSHQYLDDNPTATDQDNYTISAKVTDDDTGMGTDDEMVLVINVAPTIDSFIVTSPINENGAADLTLEFTDPGQLDTHTVEIDWGDGSPIETVNLVGGERFVFTSHQYLDDNPTGTPTDNYQVQVTIADDDGGMDSAMATVTVDNVPPTVMLNPVTMISENGLAMLSGTISDDGSLDTFTLELNWGDPLSPDNVQSFMLGTTMLTEAVDGINWNPMTREFSLLHQYLDDNPTATDQDNYTISANVTDDDTGMGMDDESVLVKNVAPTIDSLAVTSPINENGITELVFEFSDPGQLDTHTVEIDWGDGSIETILLTGGERFVFTTHQYLDDDPSGTPFDDYAVTVTVTDDDNGSDMAMATVRVNNLVPELTLNPVAMINENGLAMLSGSISDVGTLDTFTLDLNWGDPLSPDNVQSFMLGTTALTEAADGINWNPVTREFSLSHQYLDDNPTGTSEDTYTINVKVTDDDTGEDLASESVLVKNVVPVVALDPVTMINENESAVLSGTISDVGSLDTFTTIMIDWGDPLSPNNVQMFDLGTVARTEAVDGINWNPLTGAFSLSHQYLDDNPTATNGDTYTISVKVTDDDTGVGMESTTVLVNNVVPVVTLNPVAAINEFGVATLSGSVTDVGTLDTFDRLVVDWGFSDDPSDEQTLTLGTAAKTELTDGINWDPLTQTFSLSRQYVDNDADNVFQITVTIFDDDEGGGVEQVSVIVLNVNPSFLDADPAGPNVITATDVNTKGQTTLTLAFTDPGVEAAFLPDGLDAFQVLVDWGDMLGEPDLDARFVVVGTFTTLPTGEISFTHQYTGPPDPLSPAADITIRVKIRDDDFATMTPLGAVGESVIAMDVISNPGIGNEPIRVDTTPEVPRLEFRRETQGEILTIASTSAEANLRNADLRAASTESKATTERILELRVVDAYGIESEGVRLKMDVLKNLPKLFATLPDNHYRIYLIRLETDTARLVIEVYVRNGKLIDRGDDSEGVRDRPPTDESIRIQEDEEDGPDANPNVLRNMDEIRRALEAELTPDTEILIEPVDEPGDWGAERDAAPGGLLPVAVGLVATGSFSSWAQQVDRAVAEAGPRKWRELRRRSRNKRKNR